MEPRTLLRKLRRPAVGAVIFVTAFSVTIGWSAIAVAAPNAPRAQLVDGPKTHAAALEFGAGNTGDSLTPNAPSASDKPNTPGASQGTGCDTTVTSIEADPNATPEPIAPGPYKPLNGDIDYGTPVAPGADQGSGCSTDNTPGSVPGAGPNGSPIGDGTDPGPIDPGNPGDPGVPVPQPLQVDPAAE